MHLKKCTLFLSFCTVFTPKRQNYPPFERKRRDREKNFLSHLSGFPVVRGRTSSSEISHRQPRAHFLRRDFSRSGEGACFFRDFTSTATDAFFFCSETFHDRVREEHLASETPCRGGQPFFRSGSFVGRREKRRRFLSPIGTKKIPISPAKKKTTT